MCWDQTEKRSSPIFANLLLMWSWPGYILTPQILHLKNGNYCSTSLWDYSENLVTYVKLLTCCRNSIMETYFSYIVTNPQAVWHLLIFDFFLMVRIGHREKSALRLRAFSYYRESGTVKCATMAQRYIFLTWKRFFLWFFFFFFFMWAIYFTTLVQKLNIAEL